MQGMKGCNPMMKKQMPMEEAMEDGEEPTAEGASLDELIEKLEGMIAMAVKSKKTPPMAPEMAMEEDEEEEEYA